MTGFPRCRDNPILRLPRQQRGYGRATGIREGSTLILLMIDNYDSFTYNLVQYFGELDQEVQVFRNDEISLERIAALRPAYIVISPGPCTPNEAGISVPLIERFAAEK